MAQPPRVPFSTLLDSMTHAGGVWSVAVGDDWSQGRSVYGGMQAALALRSMRGLVPRDVPLRVLQVTFVGPVGPGTLSYAPRILRAGKNVTHVESRLEGEGGTLATFVGVFGRGRPSRVEVVPRPRVRAEPEQPLDTFFVPGLTPNFVRHFKMRWLHGALPYTNTPRTDGLLELALKDPGPTTEEHVVAIADTPPPLALAHLDQPAPGSSLTWTLEILRDHVGDLPLDGWRVDCDLVAGRDGYTSQSVMVWGPGGQPVALSRQSMVIFG